MGKNKITTVVAGILAAGGLNSAFPAPSDLEKVVQDAQPLVASVIFDQEISPSGYQGAGILAIGDTDGDGIDEVIVGSRYKIHVFKHTEEGFRKVFTSKDLGGDYIMGLQVGKFDDGKYPGIAVGVNGINEGRVLVIKYEGDNNKYNIVWESPRNHTTSLATLDFNGDGIEELIFGDRSSGRVFVYGSNGDNSWGEIGHTTITSGYIQNIQAGFIDNDKLGEIVVSSEGIPAVYILEQSQSGKEFPIVWDSGRDIASASWHSLAIGDWIKDGYTDLVVPSTTENSFYVISHDGKDNEYIINESLTTKLPAGRLIGGATFGDVNGDGNLNLLTSSRGSGGKVFAYGYSNGKIENTWTSSNFAASTSQVVIGDTDGDGLREAWAIRGDRLVGYEFNSVKK